MPRIVVVGCGFVGSIFATEFLKLAFAGKMPYDYSFIDSDTIEERNTANQNFRIKDAHKPKARVLRDLALDNGQSAEAHVVRLTADNIDQFLTDQELLVVDGVDNLATRQLLWAWSIRTRVPVLHLGIALDGTGKVEWTHPEHDTFSLAPHKTFGEKIIEPQSGVTPPCELVRMRASGWNTSYAAAIAAAIYLGFDPVSHMNGVKPKGWLTEWAATPMGHFPIKETWSAIETAPPAATAAIAEDLSSNVAA